MASSICIDGVTPFTTIDYPGELAAVLFCKGCPLRCRYCHNPRLQSFSSQGVSLSWEDIISFLKKRRNLLDGIVFSGGEPLSQPHLKEAIVEVKELGFKIGLHTSGAVPNRLAKVLPWLDWVGMDIKAPFDQYERITLIKNSGKNAHLAAHLLLESGVPHEFRTTVHSQLLSKNDIRTLAQTLNEMGAKNFALQNFRSQGCEDKELNASVRPFHIDAALTEELEEKFDSFICR